MLIEEVPLTRARTLSTPDDPADGVVFVVD
jgi:hypothetical protein